MINWTLTDNRRRGEVSVGVAYGTDPARVLQLLRETALAHPLVLREPDPLPLFVGFGGSSLDFSLRFWTLLEHNVDVTSQLRVALCERLAAEGIEIPFPQQDLRVREVPPSLLMPSLRQVAVDQPRALHPGEVTVEGPH